MQDLTVSVSIPEFTGAPLFYSVRCGTCGHASGWCDSERQALGLLRRGGCRCEAAALALAA